MMLVGAVTWVVMSLRSLLLVVRSLIANTVILSVLAKDLAEMFAGAFRTRSHRLICARRALTPLPLRVGLGVGT